MDAVTRRVIDGLSEAPILILGAQIALGIGFPDSPGGPLIRVLAGLLMLLATALVVVPAGGHRLVTTSAERTSRLQRFTARTREAAVLPFGLALGLDIFILSHDRLGTVLAALPALALALWAIASWLGGRRAAAPARAPRSITRR